MSALEGMSAFAEPEADQGETRHFVYVRGMRLHFRKMGDGPPVVLIHESPRSSVATVTLAKRLAGRYTTLSFDNLGFGLSTPLPSSRPTIEDFADVFADAIGAVGIERTVLYGVHTGASIAMEMARRHPHLTSLAVLDGFPVFTPQERAEHLFGYLEPLSPDWHGKFVAWLWARVRDQYTFFPWNLAAGGARLHRTPPPLGQHMAVVRDLLMAGDNYRPAYAAAFRYDPEPVLADPPATAIHATRDTDLLFGHLDRLPAASSRAGLVHRLQGQDLDRWAKSVGDLMADYPGAAEFDHSQDWAAIGGQGMAVHNAEAGPIYLHVAGPPSGPITLVIHDSPGSAMGRRHLVDELAKSERVIAPELPGHGWSPALAQSFDQISAMDERIAKACAEIGIARPTRVVGIGLGGSVAARLATRFAVPLVLVDPPHGDVDPSLYAPELRDEWSGAHLLRALYQARDGIIYDPWYDKRHERSRSLGPDLDVGALASGFRDIVLSDNCYRPLAEAALSDRSWIDTGRCLVSADRPGALDIAEALGGNVFQSTEYAARQIVATITGSVDECRR